MLEEDNKTNPAAECRGSDFGSIIMARSHGSQAGSEDFGRDEGFESGYEGEDSLQRMPSAVSIEARSAGSFGDWMNQHSRVPSAVRSAASAASPVLPFTEYA